MSQSKMSSFYDYFVPGATEAARAKAPQGMPSTKEVYVEMWAYPSIQGVYWAFTAAVRTQIAGGAVPLIQTPLDDETTQVTQAKDLGGVAVQQGISCAVSNFFSTKRQHTRSKWRNWYSLDGRWFHVSQVIGTPDLARLKAVEYSDTIEDLDVWRARWLELADIIENSAPGDLTDLDSLLDQASEEKDVVS